MLESIGTLFMALTSIVAIPLTILTFYLRSLREQHASWQRELIRRIDMMESAMTELRKGLAELERDYTTKEEWLRECMYARRMIQQLIETTVRIETVIDRDGMKRPAVQDKRSLYEESMITESGKIGPHEDRCEGGA